MRRTNASASPRTPRQSNRKENPLGDETEEDHTSSYQSPSPDRNVTNYSEPNTTPRRPVIKKTARKSTAPRRTNETTRSPREMELTRGANRDTRSSVGPNRSRDYEPRPGPSRERKQPKPKRMKPGTAALKEIRKLQNTVHNLIPKLPFSRVVREIMMETSRHPDLRVTREALMALQEASELYMTNFFEDSLRLTIHAKRVTLMPKDMQLISYLRNNWGLS